MLRAPKGEGSIVMYNNELNNLAIRKGNLFEHKGDWNTQHLYLVCDLEIKPSDYLISHNEFIGQLLDNVGNVKWISTSTPTIQKISYVEIKGKFFKRIVATTDKSLSLPLIPSSFIEYFVREQGKVNKVKILTDAFGTIIPNKEGEVIILPIEEKTKRQQLTDEEYDVIQESAMIYMRSEEHQSCSWGEVKKAYMAGAQDYYTNPIKSKPSPIEDKTFSREEVMATLKSFAEYMESGKVTSFKGFYTNKPLDQQDWHPIGDIIKEWFDLNY